MSKEKTALEKAHKRARAEEQAKQTQSVGPQQRGDNKPHPRMEMQAMLDRQEHERNQAKKEQAKPAKPRRDMQAMLDCVGAMINNLKKPSTQKSTNSKSYVERFRQAITKPKITKSNNKGNSR